MTTQTPTSEPDPATVPSAPVAAGDPVAVAEALADDLLFPAALDTDRADLVPAANLDALAAAGLYGLYAPTALGGFGATPDVGFAVIERIASGCLTTALVWLQHHGLVGNLLQASTHGLDPRLGDLATGTRRAGIVFAGVLPGPPTLTATPVGDGWVLDGQAPWVSGWGRVDVLQVAARGPDDTVVTAVLDDLAQPGLRAVRHRLAAVDASGTVRLGFTGVPVAAADVLHVVAHEPGPAVGRALRVNGSLALGVIRRCATLIGPGPLDDELAQVRQALDETRGEELAEARAAVAALAVRATAALVVHVGSRSIEVDQQAQRLVREAMFLLVFASRPSIRTALTERLLGPSA